MSLQIENFKEMDALPLCCEITIDVPNDAKEVCFPVYWTGTLMNR